MDNLILTFDITTVEIYSATTSTAGYGHKSIVLWCTIDGQNHIIKAVTNEFDLIYAALELQEAERYQALYDIKKKEFESQIWDIIETL